MPIIQGRDIGSSPLVVMQIVVYFRLSDKFNDFYVKEYIIV